MSVWKDRPILLNLENGENAPLPFSDAEYERRLARLRGIMKERGTDYVLLTSLHNIAYYTGFLYCSMGRAYGCVISGDKCTTVSANVDGGQPNRRCFGENITYTDWHRGNYWRAVKSLTGNASRLGIEADHLTLSMREQLEEFLGALEIIDLAPDMMRARMVKSQEERDRVREGARIADLGGEAVKQAIKEGAREIDIAIAGRTAMELEIARAFPDSELRDSWVWFQSGINTDGAHNPLTSRALRKGDILSMNTFPMISAYYAALERTLFLGEPDADSLKYWEANVKTHEMGIELIKPGISCAEICEELNRFLIDENLIQYRSFGYGHSFGLISQYYGREAGLELREDIDTVLEPGMVLSMEPMLTIPNGQAGAGGYREHDILIVNENGCENITGFPYGPEHNVIAA